MKCTGSYGGPGWGAPNLGGGALFGAVHGVVAAAVMPVMRVLHPRPTDRAGGSMATAGVVAGHVVYGLLVAGVYRLLVGP